MGFKNTLLPVATSVASKGRLLDLSAPVIMGILNVTPDSFFTGSLNLADILQQAERMLLDGAAILDVGGASSRPGAEAVSGDTEKDRILPVISALASRFPEAWISVDTFHADVANEAIAAGAHIVNDITGGTDDSMLDVIAASGVPYIGMHMQGSPRTMQVAPQYGEVVSEVFEYLKGIVLRCRAKGIHDVIIDPGFGFGKTVAHNYALLNDFSVFRALGRPVLAGISRKSMICKPLKVAPARALNGTTALHMAALREGASILRVHDVKEAAEAITLFNLLNAS